ncbi:histidine phosphatase family protein [Actinoplanes sp. NPDC051859]|uniref:histidine phosphatase family protein n=1 Tax=Actinoplanes sp. NPDC051859 TaxID=3363909 RepID=UPI0037A9931A
MPPTELTIARHGQAWCNQDQRIAGPATCRGLTPTGRHQAARLAARISAEHQRQPYAALYASPLPRTRQTADTVAVAAGLPVTVVDDLREPDYGTADGARWADVVAAFGAAPALNPDRPIADGGETWLQHQQRVHTALLRLVAQHTGQRILVVAHGETVTAAHHWFCHVDALPVGFAADQTALTTWRQQPISWLRPHDGQQWALIRHNDTTHLAAGHDG